ncbi:MAG: YlxR family protein [Propionibacteriaceae bacterium]|nr:YlxR family protein [Propionibacteriaceae bacterium]
MSKGRAKLVPVNRPERTCIGCRGREQKSELLRLVRKSAVIVVDLKQSGPGRGAYLHRSPDCLDLAIRRRAVGRALKCPPVDGGQVASVVMPLLEARAVSQISDAAT